MLRSLKDLERYKVRATDGDIGTIVNFLLDDKQWAVRYLVVKAGGFFNGSQVLISPIFFRQADWSTQQFHLALTMDKIKNSPSVYTDLPVSAQFEREYYRYYNYPYYWASSDVWGSGQYPDSLAVGGWSDQPEPFDKEHHDAHLRSAKEVTGYHLHGKDGVVGHVTDFLVDDRTWEVRYLVVDAAHWWAAGKEVLVSPRWATSIDWEKGEVHVDLTRQAIKSSPEWNPAEAINREYEADLYRHYDRPVYWDNGGFRNAPRYSVPADSHHSA
jgi:hypothetical protein